VSLNLEENVSRQETLARICQTFHIATLYAFGSRAREVWAWMEGEEQVLESSLSDVDVGVRPIPGAPLSVEEKVRLAMALEDLFGVGRVDLICLPEADPFLAANVVRGERLYARDEDEADEYDLYVWRRAGDLAPLERERMALVLGGERCGTDPGGL
jgi:predicted nucleotidyltransferase